MQVRNWGWIGTNGHELVEEFAGEALETVAQAKQRDIRTCEGNRNRSLAVASGSKLG